MLILELVVRGRRGTPSTLYHSVAGDDQEGYQGIRTELLCQVIGSVHRRDQVCLCPNLAFGTFFAYLILDFSPIQLVNAGVPYVILGVDFPSIPPLLINHITGHSERRTLFHETSALVAEKTRAALDASLSVILCIGETLQERESGQTTKVVEAQLQAAVDLLKEGDWRLVSLLPDGDCH